MSVFRDPRTNKWRARKMVRRPDGTKVRIFALPEHYGLPDTRIGAEEAERRAIAAVVDGATVPATGAPGAAPLGVASPPRTAAPPAPPMPTVAEFIPVWLAKSAADDKPSTAAKKAVVVRAQILPRFGSLRLDEIDYPKVEAWRLDLLKTLLPSSVHKSLVTLRGMLAYAYATDRLSRLPKWPTQRIPAGLPTFLTFEEADRLIAAAAPVDPWKAMIVVAIRTGLRHGELTALRWQDVDFAGKKLNVVENYVYGVTGTPKSGHSRVVPLAEGAIAALQAIRHDRGPLVFCTERGHHLRDWVTAHALREICRNAGFEPFGWHRLRHTFASHLAIRGVPIQVIKELLGHADIKQTLRYAHLIPETRHNAVMLLDEPAPAATRRNGRPWAPRLIVNDSREAAAAEEDDEFFDLAS